MAVDTSSPSSSVRRPSKSMVSDSASRAIASASPTPQPRCRAASATARYIAPVSRNANPSRSANWRAIVLLPAPAGPSMATIIGGQGPGVRNRAWLPAGDYFCPFVGGEVELDLAAVDRQVGQRIAFEIDRAGRFHRAQGG